jgi:hypothetical protein
MIPSANGRQRRELMQSVRAGAPAEVVDALLDALKPVLSPREWAEL